MLFFLIGFVITESKQPYNETVADIFNSSWSRIEQKILISRYKDYHYHEKLLLRHFERFKEAFVLEDYKTAYANLEESDKHFSYLILLLMEMDEKERRQFSNSLEDVSIDQNKELTDLTAEIVNDAQEASSEARMQLSKSVIVRDYIKKVL
jgi:hypothetical protein